MDYNTMSAKDFKDAVIARRESIYAKTARVGSIRAEKIMEEEYAKLCEDATIGDPIAQDLLAEWFRNGNEITPENIEMSMKWLILAGANGNKYSLDRLKIHFGFAFDSILDIDDFMDLADKFGINQYNYQYFLGMLLCKAVVEDMKIDAMELAKTTPTKLPFSAVVMRTFDRSINKAIETVIAQLRK